MGADYEFRTVWRVPGTVLEVATVLADAEALPRWWPSVYLAVDVLQTPDTETGLGAVARLHTTGWLPYTLTWTLTITSPITAEGFTLSAVGDLEGQGVWTFRQDGPEVEIVYDWRVRAGKPLLRRLSWLLRPGVRGEPPLGDAPRGAEPGARAAPAARERATCRPRRRPPSADHPPAVRTERPTLSRRPALVDRRAGHQITT